MNQAWKDGEFFRINLTRAVAQAILVTQSDQSLYNNGTKRIFISNLDYDPRIQTYYIRQLVSRTWVQNCRMNSV